VKVTIPNPSPNPKHSGDKCILCAELGVVNEWVADLIVEVGATEIF